MNPSRHLTILPLLFLLIIFGNTLLAQVEVDPSNSVGVGTANPNQNAKLHIHSADADKGFLMPRMDYQQMQNMQTNSSVPLPDGLEVYATSLDDALRGPYYWDQARQEWIGAGSQMPCGSVLNNPTAQASSFFVHTNGINFSPDRTLDGDLSTSWRSDDPSPWIDVILGPEATNINEIKITPNGNLNWFNNFYIFYTELDTWPSGDIIDFLSHPDVNHSEFYEFNTFPSELSWNIVNGQAKMIRIWKLSGTFSIKTIDVEGCKGDYDHLNEWQYSDGVTIVGTGTEEDPFSVAPCPNIATQATASSSPSFSASTSPLNLIDQTSNYWRSQQQFNEPWAELEFPEEKPINSIKVERSTIWRNSNLTYFNNIYILYSNIPVSYTHLTLPTILLV